MAGSYTNDSLQPTSRSGLTTLFKSSQTAPKENSRVAQHPGRTASSSSLSTP